MTIDEAILKALEGGPVTVNGVTKRFVSRVRSRLEKLRVRGVVVREGKGGAHREHTYRLVQPHRAAKALCEKGGLAPPRNVRAARAVGSCQSPSLERDGDHSSARSE
jgi:hypothetical protein